MVKATRRTITVSTRIPPEMAAALQRMAEREERTASQIIARILKRELEALGELSTSGKLLAESQPEAAKRK
jgi:predicted DNA-binding protein